MSGGRNVWDPSTGSTVQCCFLYTTFVSVVEPNLWKKPVVSDPIAQADVCCGEETEEVAKRNSVPRDVSRHCQV